MGKERWPSVAVIIPNQSRVAELARALRSVEAQRYDGKVVTYLIHEPRPELEELIPLWPGPVIAIPHHADPTASSIAARRNIGLAESQEDLVAFLDDDDLWHPDKLRFQIDAMTGRDAAASWTGWINNPPGSVLAWPPQNPGDPRRLSAYDFMRSGKTVTSSMVVEGPLARTLGFDENPDWLGLDDYDFKLRLGKQAGGILLPQTLTAIGIDPLGGSRSDPAAHFARAFGVFLAWAGREGWSVATWRAFFVRWAVTATFPRGQGGEGTRELAQATDGRLPHLVERFVRWSIVRAWRSKKLIPALRRAIPARYLQ